MTPRPSPPAKVNAKLPLFAPDPDFWHNAYLDRVSMPWFLYADGYKKAADLLAERCETFYDKNTLVYPIVFLYRHYIELTLKELILDGNKVAQKTYPLPKHHKLDDLWSVCKSIIRERGLPISRQDRSAIGGYIGDFNQFDPTSEAFRYPVTKEGLPSLPPNIDSISLRRLRGSMTKLGKLLRQVTNLLGADIDLENEFRSELYPEP